MGCVGMLLGSGVIIDLVGWGCTVAEHKRSSRLTVVNPRGIGCVNQVPKLINAHTTIP